MSRLKPDLEDDVPLTPRQLELVTWLLGGETLEGASKRMYCSYSTVRQLSEQARERLEVDSLPQLTARAVELGLAAVWDGLGRK